MPDSMLIAIATTLATKAAGSLFDLVKSKFGKRGAKDVAVLDAAAAAGPESPEVGELAAALDAAVADDPAFAEQLRTQWRAVQTTGTGDVHQTITGNVGGRVIQARDIQGGITFN